MQQYIYISYNMEIYLWSLLYGKDTLITSPNLIIQGPVREKKNTILFVSDA